MDKRIDRQPPHAALIPSSVRRWRVAGPSAACDVEHVRHVQVGQEWAPHWHDEWSIGVVASGRCRFSLAGRSMVATAGDVIAIAPLVVHTGALDSGEFGNGADVVMVYAPQTWLSHVGLSVPDGSALTHAPLLAHAGARIQTLEEAALWAGQALAVLCDAQAVLPPIEPPQGEPAARVLLALREAALQGGNASVADLAQACELSREYFHRIAIRWLGMSPNAYIRAVRMGYARRLLLSGASISAVAHGCGFADQAHFTRWFRRCFGYTPGALVIAQAQQD